MAARGKKENQKRSSDMSSEEIEKYFKDKGIDINEEILKSKRIVLKYKRLFDEEKKRKKESKNNTKKMGVIDAEILNSEEEKGEEKVNVNKIGDSRDDYRMACNGLYGEDGTSMK